MARARVPRIFRQFGRRVRQLRQALGMSQEAFALFVGLNRTHYGVIERGEANVELLTIATIAAGLGVEPRDLFEFG